LTAEPNRIWLATFTDLPEGATIAVGAPDSATAAHAVIEASFMETQEREREAREDTERFWLPDLSGMKPAPVRDFLWTDGRDE
jgi:hypothetical protein